MGYARRSRPAYLRIADRLRQAIAEGRWGPGDMLPSANELAEQLGSTRTTVASAIDLLRREGLVYSQQGRGAFVRERPQVRHLDFAHGERGAGAPLIDPSLEAIGLTPVYRYIGIGPEPASEDVAARLGIRAGERVMARRFVMLGDDVPMELLASYFPYDMVAGTRLAEPEPTQTYTVLREEFGVDLSHFIQDIRSRMPDPEESRLLELGEGDTVLHLIRTAYDANGTPVNVLDAVLPGDRHAVRHRIPAGLPPDPDD